MIIEYDVKSQAYQNYNVDYKFIIHEVFFDCKRSSYEHESLCSQCTLLVLIDFCPVQIKIEALYTKNEDFDQTCLNTGSKTQNVEELSLDLIFC